MRTWLLIDVSYVCHRAWHALPRLSHHGKPTDAIFGFLRTVDDLRGLFATDDVVFCFDSAIHYRNDILPTYKEKRHSKPDPHREKQLRQLRTQIRALYKRHLPLGGFNNIFRFRGMESDDILAVVARRITRAKAEERAVIVTGDSDLYQCLSRRVAIWDPSKKKYLTLKWFRKHYGIEPREWAVVKAIAGCQTDQVPGVGGIGEITALKYLRNEPHPDKVETILASRKAQKIIFRNLRLVRLPFDGCPDPNLQPQEADRKKWNQMLVSLGIRSY